MKHNWKLTAILLGMFLVAQFIGLYVVSSYPDEASVPDAFRVPEPQTEKDFWFYFLNLLPAFVIAILLVFLFSKYKFKFLMKLWFFVVVFIALSLTFNAFLKPGTGLFHNVYGFSAIALAISFPLAISKIYRPSIIIQNFTEVLIYPGISIIFVQFLNPLTAIALLILISIYDMWAVWHSGIMQKMVKFQMNELRVFGGFLIPHLTKSVRTKIKNLRTSKFKKSKGKKIRIGFAILGGGDVVFPIIMAGTVLRAVGLIPALFVTAGAFIGLTFLFFISEKKKSYPAMPFITAGILLGLAAGLLV